MFGCFWGTWAVAAADIEHALRMSHGAFGLLLSAAIGAGAFANAVGGNLAEHRGTGRVLAASLATWGVLLALTVIVDTPALLAALIVVALATGGLVDVVMNVAATAALAHTPGALVRFHSQFNAGAALGALGAGVAIGNHVWWRWTWLGVGVASLGLAVVCVRARLPAGEPGERSRLTDAFRLLRREKLLVVAAAFGVGAMVEGGVSLWGVLYLRTQLRSGLLVGSASAVAGYAVAALVRYLFGPSVGRSGASVGVAVGAGVAAAGLTVLGLGAGAWLAALGLVAAAGGISLCWPLLLAHASAASPRPGSVVGSVSGVGYLGLVLGPAIVGELAGRVGLQTALEVLAVAAAFVAISPRLSGRRS
ncbi:MAG: MFS transporter [Acidimicrobiales bacterium]